ncbi:MAG: multidrug effflux MFS transporter [Microbacteriaceae bacterium]|nr:multidrug effflux MFS transporter [Microbacteriaceae bacterium]
MPEPISARGGAPRSLVPVLGLLSTFGPLAIDLYLPALPGLVVDLGATDSLAQFTIGAFMLGLALGQLIIGPLSDRYGRRPLLLTGTALFVVLSIACALAPTIELLIATRLVQGAVGAAGIVMGRAIIRDVLIGDAAARAFALFGAIIGIAPVIAPIIGAGLLQVTDWRGLFVALAVMGAGLTTLAALAVPETLPPERRTPAGLRAQLGSIVDVLRNRRFVACVAVLALASLGLFAYISMSSLVLQHEFDFDEGGFAIVFAVNGVGIMVGSMASRALTGPWSAARLALVGVSIGAVGSVALLVGALVGAPLIVLLAAMFVTVLVHGANLGNLTALGMTAIDRGAGTAAAVLGALQMSVGAIVPPLASIGGVSSIVMGATMSAGLVGALALLLVIRRRDGGAARR